MTQGHPGSQCNIANLSRMKHFKWPFITERTIGLFLAIEGSRKNKFLVRVLFGV